MKPTLHVVRTRKELREFIYLPEVLHANHPNWVPPFYADERRILDPRLNLSHQYCDSVYVLARQGGKAVGRIAGIVNHRYNEYQFCRVARFGYLETIDDLDVTQALLEYAENWARSQNMDRIVGPMGFTEEDPEGMMIEGFDEVPNLATYQNFAWLPSHMETLGYTKEVDYVVYKVKLASAITPSFDRLYRRTLANSPIRLKDFASRRQLKPYVIPVFRLMNESFSVIYGYSPLSEPEMRQLAQRYWALLDPRFIKVAVDPADAVVGFILAVPSIASGLVKARGRLFPLGFLHILRAMKTSTKLDTYLGAVKPAYNGRGVDILLGHSIITEAINAGFEYMDGHHQLETNHRIRAEMRNVGGEVCKRYRIYRKELR